MAAGSIVAGPGASAETPEWCKALPRPEYKALERVRVSDPWFEVYKPAKNVFAIYEPHQAEETIGYLIVGDKRALLFDTGMGISDVKKVTVELTKLPIVVVNSHTHDDHVGGNWEFETVYGMDTEFTRTNAKGSRADAQAEIAGDQICGECRRDSTCKAMRRRPGIFRGFCTMGTRSNSEIARWK
jgi:metal-dependent hydrolase (beta-lactamase superfamily II)